MKYLACDLDGTLVQHDQSIKKEDIDAILRLKESGHKFIISTGRSLKGIYNVFDRYPEIKYDYIIAGNGSIILDNNKNVIYDNYISNDTANSLFKEFINEKDIYIHFENEGDNYLIESEDLTDIRDMMCHFKEIVSEDTLFKEERRYSIIGLFAKNKDIDKAENAKNLLLEKYGQELEAFRNQYFVDIAPKDCSKGNGLKKILELNKAYEDKLYAIGDSFNDVSMFELTENSFTFHYAEEKLKNHANNIVSSVSECIEKILD